MAIREPRTEYNGVHFSFRQSRSIDVPQLIHIVFGCAGTDAIATIHYSQSWRHSYPASLSTERDPWCSPHRTDPRIPVPAAAGPAPRIVPQRRTVGPRTPGGDAPHTCGPDGTDGGERRRNRNHSGGHG